MNKKMSTLSDKFIMAIKDKSQGTSKEITARLELKEKEMML